MKGKRRRSRCSSCHRSRLVSELRSCPACEFALCADCQSQHELWRARLTRVDKDGYTHGLADVMFDCAVTQAQRNVRTVDGRPWLFAEPMEPNR